MNVQKDLVVSGRLTLTNSGGTTPAANKIAVSTNSSGLVDFVSLSSIPTAVTSSSSTPNFIAKWTSSGVIGDSLISDNGTYISMTGSVGIGTSTPQQLLEVSNASSSTIRITRTTGPVRMELSVPGAYATIGTITNHPLNILVNSVPVLELSSSLTSISTDSINWFDSSAGSIATLGSNSFTLYGQGEEIMLDMDRVYYNVMSRYDLGVGTLSGTKRATFTITNAADISGINGTTTANASTTITGTATGYLSQVGIGDRISLSSAPSTYATVTAIASHTSLTTSAALGNGTTQTINVKSAISRWDKADGTTALYMNDEGRLVIGGITVPTVPFEVIDSSTGTPTVCSLRSTASAVADRGATLSFGANRTTNGSTSVAQLSGIITDTNASTYKGAMVFKTADGASPVERWRMNNKGHLITQETDANPALGELTNDQIYFLTTDRLAIYMKSDRFVIAYNLSGTVAYLTIPLNGSTTTWTQSTTAP